MKSNSNDKPFNSYDFFKHVFKNPLRDKVGHFYSNSPYLRFCFLVYYFDVDIFTAYKEEFQHKYSGEPYYPPLGLDKIKKEFFNDLPRSTKNKNSKLVDFQSVFMNCLEKLNYKKSNELIVNELKDRLNSSPNYEVIDSDNKKTSIQNNNKYPKTYITESDIIKIIDFFTKDKLTVENIKFKLNNHFSESNILEIILGYESIIKPDIFKNKLKKSLIELGIEKVTNSYESFLLFFSQVEDYCKEEIKQSSDDDLYNNYNFQVENPYFSPEQLCFYNCFSSYTNEYTKSLLNDIKTYKREDRLFERIYNLITPHSSLPNIINISDFKTNFLSFIKLDISKWSFIINNWCNIHSLNSIQLELPYLMLELQNIIKMCKNSSPFEQKEFINNKIDSIGSIEDYIHLKSFKDSIFKYSNFLCWNYSKSNYNDKKFLKFLNKVTDSNNELQCLLFCLENFSIISKFKNEAFYNLPKYILILYSYEKSSPTINFKNLECFL